MMRKSSGASRRTDGAEFLLLQHAQQLGLQIQRAAHRSRRRRQCPPLASSSRPELVLCRPREGAFDVAEELAFHERADHGRAIDSDERAGGLASCTARATTSLPVPVSPSSSAGQRPRPSFSIKRITWRIRVDCPIRTCWRGGSVWQSIVSIFLVRLRFAGALLPEEPLYVRS